jgi:hypothetical protein
MASGTPDWSALGSENERFLADGGASGERLVPPSLWEASGEQVTSAAQPAPARAPAPAPVPARAGRLRWRIRAATAGAGAAPAT